MSALAFSCLADIEALERTPYEEALPARSTYGLIRRAAQLHAQRDALVYLPSADVAQPAQRVTYQALLGQIHRAANLFRALGIGAHDTVAILAPNIPQTHYALWGAQIAGKVCPINYLLQPEHIAALLEASGARLVVALGPNTALDIWSTVEKVLAFKPIPVIQISVESGAAQGVPVFETLLEQHSDTLGFEPDLSPERIAACFHTGGTTGAPKLAQHNHGNEAHTAWFAHRFYGFDEHTVELNGFPLFHVAGAFVYGLSLLAIGAAQVLPTLNGLRDVAFMRNYWKFCARERVTALACVPTVLAGLLAVPVDADISSIKVAYTGGAPLPSELAASFEAYCNIPVRNILGMTECAGLVSIEPAAAARVPGSTGLRLPYTHVCVVPWRGGAVHLNESCASGETGVVVVRGPHVSPGYTDASKDDGMFAYAANDPVGARWLISGDLGHLDADGRLFISGRAKDVIIRSAHNIDPALVEDAFLAHPSVAMCAVVAEPDAYAGELPVTFVTLKPGLHIEPDALLLAVAANIYERPAVPKRVTVIEAMPLTAIGKIYKPALRQRAIETKLAELLADVKGISVSSEERSGVLQARVTYIGAHSTKLEQSLRARLAAIAVQIEWVFKDA
jgi:fatty-acyl-CoA synthase